MFDYFVCFVSNTGNHLSFGHCVVSLEDRISSLEDLDYVAEKIKTEGKCTEVVIVNYKIL